jgi:hypothetical protein
MSIPSKAKKGLAMTTDELHDLSSQAFETWLLVDKNVTELKKIAFSIYKKMEMNKVNLPGVDIRLTDSEEILQELMSFLLNDGNVRGDLLAGGPGIMNRLKGYFWHRIIDMSRSGEGNQDIYKDTWRLFYRHIVDVIGKSDQFVKVNLSRPIAFGRSHEPSRTVVMIEDLMDIPFPQDIPADFQALNTKKNILLLAEHFWEQAAQEFEEPHIQLSVRDFMTWIGKYVNLGSVIDSYPENQADEDQNESLTKLAKQKPNAEAIIKKKSLMVWAGNFYHLLKDLEKKVFYYYECMGLTHQEISVLMDKKGSLSYQRDKVKDLLRTFLRPLDLISPDYGREVNDPADFIFFSNQLCSQLKTFVEGD